MSSLPKQLPLKYDMAVYHFSISEHRFVKGRARGRGEGLVYGCVGVCHMDMLDVHWTTASAVSSPWEGRETEREGGKERRSDRERKR